MSATDILPQLDALLAARQRRRLLVLLGLVLALLLAHRWQTPQGHGLPVHSVLASAAKQAFVVSEPPAHLLQLVDGRSSAYGHVPSLPLAVSAVVVIANEPGLLPHANLALVLRLLLRYPFFKEIILWNDAVMLGGADLKHQDLIQLGLRQGPHLHPTPKIRILNSPGAMREMSYHMACSLARSETCYFNDPNVLNFNLDTLYTNYVESDAGSKLTICSQVTPADYLAELPHEVSQSDHHIRTGVVSRLGRGSLVAKQLSLRYFRQLATASLPPPSPRDPPPLGRLKWMASDIQFSIWSNRSPRKLVSQPKSLVDVSQAHSQPQVDPQVIKSSYQRLNETIQSSDPFVVPETFPRPLPFVKSTHSHHQHGQEADAEAGVASSSDDRSMLMTSLGFSEDWPLAVDGDLDTCWTGSLSLRKSEDFVGLNFVVGVKAERISLIGRLQPERWKLQLLLTGEKAWTHVDVVPRVSEEGRGSQRYLYDVMTAGSIQHNDGPQQSLTVKKIRLVNRLSALASLDDQSQLGSDSITVCGWVIGQDWEI